MALTPEHFLQLTDCLGRMSLEVQKSVGLLELTDEYSAILFSTRSHALLKRNHEPLDNLSARATRAKLCRNHLFRLVQSLVHSTLGEVPSGNGIEKFCEYYNTGKGGPYNALVTPAFDELFGFCYTGSSVGAANIASAPVEFMGYQAVDGVFEPGNTVERDDTGFKTAGLSRLRASLKGGAFMGEASGAVIAIGTGRTADGVILPDRQWAFRLPGKKQADGSALMDGGAVAKGDLCLRVEHLRFPGNMTAGSVTVSGIEAG